MCPARPLGPAARARSITVAGGTGAPEGTGGAGGAGTEATPSFVAFIAEITIATSLHVRPAADN